MRRVIPWLLFSALLAPAQTPQKRPDFLHLFYLDSSGSMKERVGAAGSSARAKLAGTMFKSDWLFHAGQDARLHRFTVQVEPVTGLPPRPAQERLAEFVNNDWAITSGDTDLTKVLEVANQSADKERRGRTTLAWILTDNVNDPRGHGGDVENTQAFYGRMFQANSNVQRVYFFPMPELKLVLYLLVLSPDPKLDGLDLDLFENALGAYARNLKAPRIRAKPVGGDRPLEFDPRVQFDGPSTEINAEMIGTGRRGIFVVHGLKEGEPLSGVFKVRLRSRFDEWRVEKAVVERTSLDGIESSDFPNLEEKLSARLSPNSISVDPQSTSSIVYSLELGSMEAPLTPQAPFFSLAALNPDAQGIVHGRLSMRIGSPKMRLKIFNDPQLTSAVQKIFRLEDIEYFVPQNLAAEHIRLDFSIPVEFEVSYRWWTRWLALGGILLVPLCIGFFVLRGSSTPIVVLLEGYSSAPVTLVRGATYPISPGGKPLAELIRTRTGVACRALPGATVNGTTGMVELKTGSPVEIQSEGAVYRYRFEILRASAVPPAGKRPGSGYY